MKDKLNIPVQFEKISNILDNRFMKVKIWIAHTGENRNGSIFTKELLTEMIPSLANIPILGYIGVNSEDETDFRAHEERLIVENKEFKLDYIGHAYGVIPAENNARFEFRYGEDGIEREYLVCEGLLWNKFRKVAEIFDRDNGFKWQSLELEPSSVDGYHDENGLFVFTKAKFEGACVLGEDINPAMISSTIERFSVSTVRNDLNEILTELSTYFSAIVTNEGGENVEGTNVIEKQEPVVEETPVVEEPIVEDTPTTEKPTTEFTEEQEPVVEEEPVVEGEESETEEVEETPAVEEPTNFTRTFELSHEDIRSGLYQALYGHTDFEDAWTWITEVYDNHFIMQNEDNGKWYKMNYVKHESAVSLGEYEELFPMFLTQAEKASIDSTRNNFEALEQEVGELRNFKAGIELAEKESKLAQYSTVLSEDEYKTIKENLTKFSMKDIEKEIGFLLLQKNHFSVNKQEEKQDTQVRATNVAKSNPYGEASIYFQ